MERTSGSTERMAARIIACILILVVGFMIIYTKRYSHPVNHDAAVVLWIGSIATFLVAGGLLIAFSKRIESKKEIQKTGKRIEKTPYVIYEN